MKNNLLKGILSGFGAVLAFIIILTVAGVSVNGYMLASLLYAGVFVCVEAGFYKTSRKKEAEFTAIDGFLSEVRRHFYNHGMADEAVLDASYGLTDGYMKRNADDISDVLSDGNLRDAADAYRYRQNNRYLKLFVTLCVTVIEYGDRKINGQSLFLANLLNLKNELRTELEEDRNLRAKMSGMGLVTVIPALVLGMIEHWCTSNLPQLEAFYAGTGGISLKTALFLCSVVIYLILCILRGMTQTTDFLLPSLGRWCNKTKTTVFLKKVELLLPKTTQKLNALIYESGVIINIKELYALKLILAVSCLSVLLTAKIIGAVFGKNGMHFLIIIMIALLAFFVPDVLLRVKRFVNRIRMEEEVLQFQSAISMLMHVEQLSVYDILVELEQFAEIFKRSISDCLNDYHIGENAALEEMRDKEGCEAFRRLTESFIASDRIGIGRAFDEIDSDRAYYLKKRERENMKSITNRAVLGKFLAFIPLVAVIAFYLIIPFAKESMNMLSEISAEFGSF